MNTNINGSKYDYSLERTYSFYDSLPYERNVDVCGEKNIALYSGNVVKYATYTEQEAFVIPNNDDVLLSQIRHQQELLSLEAELANA